MKHLSPKLLSVRLACWAKKQLSVNRNTTERTPDVWTHTGKKEALFRRVRKIAETATSFVMSVCLSVRPHGTTRLTPTGRIFMKFDIWVFFENLYRNLMFHYNLTRIAATWHESQYTFLIVSRSLVFRMTNVSDKCCRKSQNTHFLFNNFFSKIVPFMR
jgi:hypothetical protein